MASMVDRRGKTDEMTEDPSSRRASTLTEDAQAVTTRVGAAYLAAAPRVISWVAGLLGVLALLDSLWPHHWRVVSVLTPTMPLPARAAADAIVATSGLLLLRVSRGLRKHKRAEWRIAVCVCVAMILADLLRDERRPVEAIVTVALLITLLITRRQFRAKADPHSRWFSVRLAVQCVLVGVAYGMVLLYLPHHVAGHVSFWLRLKEVLTSLAGMGGWISIRDDGYGDFFHVTLLAVGIVTVVAAVLLALRPAEPLAFLSGDDEQRLRELLRTQGERDSLGYFALRRDKSIVWSRTGKAAISYRVVSGVALVSGDPIGDPEAWPGAVDAYRDLVEEYGWVPAVLGCSETGATVFQRTMGLSALALGDEAVLYAETFDLSGRPMRGVRQACSRTERAGYTASISRVRDLSEGDLLELRKLAADWRGDQVERGFSMALSRLGDSADPECVVALARLEGKVRGMLHFVPWGKDGISLDLMRRDRSSDNGLNEFMITSVMQACPSLGVRRVSLNFAVFREALERGERIGAGPVLRLWRRVLLLASRWWQIDSLYRFNAKFRPEWQPRFVSYPAARDIPRIGLAALEAEAFIVRPERLKRLVGRG